MGTVSGVVFLASISVTITSLYACGFHDRFSNVLHGVQALHFSSFSFDFACVESYVTGNSPCDFTSSNI